MESILGLKRRKGYVLSKFVQFIVVLGIILYVISLLTAVYLFFLRSSNDLHFSNETRSFIVGVLFLPALLSCLVVYFYERLHPQQQLSNQLIITLLLFQIYLLIPCAIFVFRYADWISTLAIVSGIFGISLPFLPNLSQMQKENFLKQIATVYWTVWLPECKDIDNNRFKCNPKKDKEVIYTDMKVIKTFQESFVPCSRETDAIKHYLNTTKKNIRIQKSNLHVLDIGGYDGGFTSRLFKKLGLQADRIEVIEPIDEEVNYRKKMSPFSLKIDYFNKGWEMYPTSKNYDLVIASHSLYSCFDNDKFEKDEDIVARLSSFVNNNGWVLVIIGNSNGKAYTLKKELSKLILNENANDLDSNIFKEIVDKQGDFEYKRLSVDNYIEIDNLLSNEESLKEWVSYFARVPIVQDPHMTQGIKDLFNIYSVKYSNLPEETKKLYLQSKGDMNLLSHKTDIFLMKKKLNNDNSDL